jgi:hypothetical protein
MSRSQVTYKTLMDAKAITKNTTQYTDSYDFHQCAGDAALKIIITSSGAPTFTISQQCSLDDVNWYNPVNEAGALGGIWTAHLKTAGAYVSFTPVMADFIRFKVTETGNVVNGTVTITLISRLEV